MTVSTRDHSVKHFERTRPVFVIGIGSPHGDDRAGWEVIDRLASARTRSVVLHKASVPHDILDWLDVDAQTHIIDASFDKVPELRRFAITHDISGKLHLSAVGLTGTKIAEFASEALRSSSTHQLDLLSTLELSAALGRLPRQLFLWTVSIASVAKNGDVTKETQARIDKCVMAIATELRHA